MSVEHWRRRWARARAAVVQDAPAPAPAYPPPGTRPFEPSADWDDGRAPRWAPRLDLLPPGAPQPRGAK